MPFWEVFRSASLPSVPRKAASIAMLRSPGEVAPGTLLRGLAAVYVGGVENVHKESQCCRTVAQATGAAVLPYAAFFGLEWARAAHLRAKIANATAALAFRDLPRRNRVLAAQRPD